MGWGGNTQGRYGMIENIDDNFGVLMEKLDQWQAWEDTLVIFMTDNGQAGRRGKLNGKPTNIFSAGFKSGKGSPYEGGTHVPAFWRWKGKLAEGQDIGALTAHIDLYRTFCELAGVRIPGDVHDIDGRSLVPLLEDPNADWADRHLFTHQGRWKSGTDPNDSKFKNCAVRTKRWRFVNNSELYDISKDPYETTNVMDSHPQVVNDLRKSYDQWWEETVPMMVNEDASLSEEQPQTVRFQKQSKAGGIPDWTPPQL